MPSVCCDGPGCKKEVVQDGGVRDLKSMLATRFTLTGMGPSTLIDTLHFCSLRCLRIWLAAVAESQEQAS
jgi:hypothetical protein